MNSLRRVIYPVIMFVLLIFTVQISAQTFTRTQNGYSGGDSDYSDFYLEETDDSEPSVTVSQYRYDESNGAAADKTAFIDDPREAAYRKREKVTTQPQTYNNAQVSAKTYDLTGLASWYGRKYQGRPTASGEKFDMYAYTAAHKTLPFGTILMVTNLSNGKSVKVKVNDRGPYVEPRIIDLSYAAARDLDMLKSGEANVGIKILEMGDGTRVVTPTTTAVAPAGVRYNHVNTTNIEQPVKSNPPVSNTNISGNFKLQVGAFYSRVNAEKLKSKLGSMFDNPVEIIHENDMYKVRVINIPDKYEAERYRSILANEDLPGYVIKN